MSRSREAILEGIRRSHGRAALPAERREALERALAAPEPRLVPQRARGTHEEMLDLFKLMAKGVSTTLSEVGSWDDVPSAVADFLKSRNLPTELAVAPDPRLDAIERHPLLTARRGPALPQDTVGVAAAFAGVAETGTLMLVSGPDSPTSLNFLPDVHVVVLDAKDVAGGYEEAWAKLRSAYPKSLPRTVNFVTGPSRTGDIEQTIQLGAHGPRQLHVVLVDGRAAAQES